LLVERGEITFSTKVANAEAAGATGVIVYNNRAGVVNGRLSGPGGIPAAGISQADGQGLVALLAGGPVTVRLETKTETRTATSQNVVGTPPDGACSIVAGGHYDSVPEGPGANDNASGTAVVLEMARTRAANQAMDGVCYVLFGSEEIGLVGSGEYVQSLTSEQVDGLDAMLNPDTLAVVRVAFIGSPRLRPRRQRRSAGNPPHGATRTAENVGMTINFVQAGVPSIIFNCFCDTTTLPRHFRVVLPERLSQAGESAWIIDDVLSP
jgi:Zn-dependent M28 family amino/carboxypeptidase